MSGTSRIEFTSLPPRAPNCLEWSEDGEIAVAANDSLYILHPRLNVPTDGLSTVPSGESWHRLKLQVDSFTEQEWPAIGLQPMDSFSIAEEQGQAEIFALAWSSPGLSEDSRCCLAVLTSNHMLSIWGPGRDPTQTSGWKRHLIVNHSISNRSARVIAARWLPALDPRHPVDAQLEHPSKAPTRRIHCLAALDMDDILHIIQISKDIFGNLRAKEVASCSLPQLTLSTLSDLASPLERAVLDAQDTQWRMHTAGWSTWRNEPGSSNVSDTFGIQSDVLGLKVTYRSGNLFDMSQVDPSLPLIDKFKPSKPSIWEGAVNYHASTLSTMNEPRSYIMSSGQGALPRTFEVQSNPSGRGDQSSFRLSEGESSFGSQVEELLREFSEEYKLGGQANALVWGTSSWQDDIATCVTVHPSHGLQYPMPSTSKIYLLFSKRS